MPIIKPKMKNIENTTTDNPSLPALSSTRIPRTTEEMVSQAASLTDLSLEALEQIVRYGAKESDRIAAAIALLDRGHGKPTQQLVMRSNATTTFDGQFEEIKALTGRDLRNE